MDWNNAGHVAALNKYRHITRSSKKEYEPGAAQYPRQDDFRNQDGGHKDDRVIDTSVLTDSMYVGFSWKWAFHCYILNR